MKNLQKLALEATQSLVSTRKAKNINQRLIEILGQKGEIKKTREELRAEIAIARILEEIQFDGKLLIESEAEKLFDAKDEAFLAFFNKTAKTVKNGLDTSISGSKNNSSFSYNKLYEHLELKSDADGKYSIITKTVK